MKVIIAGGRDQFPTVEEITAAVHASKFNVTEVVSGCARGADQMGECWAVLFGIPVKPFPANWCEHGNSAGAIRNGEMAKYGEALIAFWDGKSSGTGNMIKQAKRRGLAVHVVPR